MLDSFMCNDSPYAAAGNLILNALSEEALMILIQATFSIEGNSRLVFAAEQREIPLGGEWNGDPGRSSYRWEPQFAPSKPSTDVVLIGHAYPVRTGDRQVDVGLRAGKVAKSVRVFGDRRWIKAFGGEALTKPEPIEKVPLTYERAFGGWDRRHTDAGKHRCERRNPMGKGYRHGPSEDGWPAPNLEDPAHPMRSSADTPPPAGFGFLAPDWLPRSRYAGTYDARWRKERMPLLPEDFHPRFYQAAHPNLIPGTRMRGDEAVVIAGASPRGRLAFDLPGLPPPAMSLESASGRSSLLSAELDTVGIDTDAHEARLLWRACIPLEPGLRAPRKVILVAPSSPWKALSRPVPMAVRG
jgi:hypothetical protein